MPGVPSLRSKLCQVYSCSQPRWCCRLAPWSTLTDQGLGYMDHAGIVTLTIFLDMDPCVDVKIITKADLKENLSKSLFDESHPYKQFKMPKNYR